MAKRVLAMLAALALSAGAAQAPAEEDEDDEVKDHRMAVTVTNIGKKAPLGQPILLRSRLAWRGPKAKFFYEWSTVAGPTLPDGVDVNAKSLEIPPRSLEAGQHYHLRLVVIATMKGGKEARASSDVKFAANEPPAGGRCTVKAEPLRGGAMRLALAAPGWTDPDSVQYRFEVRRGDRIVAVQNWRNFATYSATVRLKPGQQVFGRCHVRDRLGDGLTMDTRKVGLP